MDRREALERENAALRERGSKLHAAILRIGASLDPRHRPARGRRQRPRAHRRPLRHDRDLRRDGRDRGVHRPRPVGRRTPAHGRVAARPRLLRAPARPAGSAQGGRPAGLSALARLRGRTHALEDPAGDADAPSRRACRPLLPRREGAGPRVHRRRRGGAGAVRLPGGGGGRQRAGAPRRAARAGRPGGAGRHLAGRRRGVRCRERPSGLVQPRGAAHRGGAALARPAARGAGGDDRLPAARRTRGPAERALPGRDGAPRRRWSSRCPTGAASPRCSTRRRSG